MIKTSTLTELSPVELTGGLYLKREDKFAPWGEGGINGSKVRQCIYLVDQYVRHSDIPLGLVSGASVKSSQLPVGTIVAKEFGLPSVHVIGSTNPTMAIRHEQVRIAHHYGAEFDIIKIAYNPALQRRVDYLASGPLKGWFKLEYGSSINHKTHSPEDVAAFHGIGAWQVQNIPSEVDTLIVPTGSCNTLVSVLYGIGLFKSKIKKVVCLQIGPNKLIQTNEKLMCIEEATGLDLREIEREYHNLSKRWSYQDDVHFNFEGIEMHPTYEGKCFTYLAEHPELMNDHACFWLTGAKPYLRNMDPAAPQYTSVRVWQEP